MKVNDAVAKLRVLLELPLPVGRGSLPFELDALVKRAPGRLAAHRAGNPFAPAGESAFLEALSLPDGTQLARENARRLFAGEAISVTAGQQAGYCGGPFLLLLKIATAVALADRLGERGIPAVPVFWNAADDTDFDETSTAWLAGEALTLVKRTLPAGTHASGMVIGAVPVDASRPGLRELFPHPEALGEFGRALDVADTLWQEAAAAARDMGTMNGAFLARLFAAEGLVVVDARAASLREASRGVFARYLDRHETVRDALASRAAAILSSGGERALDDGALSWCLFRREGDTRVRMEERDRLERARDLFAEKPPALSPNVVLRPVVEDSLFPHVARVVGPAELRYHDELAPAYEILGYERAYPVSRLAATYLPPEAERISRHRDRGPAALWEDFDGVLREAAGRESPLPGIRERLATLRRDWEKGITELRTGGGEGTAGGWRQEVERSAGKVDYELRRLEETLDEQNRRALYKREPRLRELKNSLFPRGLPQERLLSLSSIVSLWGAETPRRLVELAGRHLERLQEGSCVHYGVGDD